MLPDRSSSPKSHMLLIVEDEPSLLRAFAHAFVRHGYVVLQASDVPSALAHWTVDRDRISMVVSDVQMPGPPIEGLIAAIHASERPTPILLISGQLRGSEQRIRDLISSVTGFLPKPLRIDALRLEVERTLRGLPPR